MTPISFSLSRRLYLWRRVMVTTIAVIIGLLGSLVRSLVHDGAGATGPLGAADGYVAVGASISPFSTTPAIANLTPGLRRALRDAASDARADGIALRVDSGWRSARYQKVLLSRAIKTYGSLRAARRYVLAPDRSSHVSGKAVDVGPTAAALWLSQHGAAYGLCQMYANERWHFERATTRGGTCPPMATDASAG
jgi:D-alanyl-D-alanine carboxypeptidase